MGKSREQDPIITLINSNPLTRDEMVAYLKEVETTPREDRCFETNAIAGFTVFQEPDKTTSIMFRMEAIARMIEQGLLPGWSEPPDNPDGPWSVREALFAAVGVTPVLLNKDGKVVFDKDSLLKTVFQLGKNKPEDNG